MAKRRAPHKDDEDFVRAAWDNLADTTAGTPYKSLITVKASPTRGRMMVEVSHWLYAPDGTRQKAASAMVEYPNSRAMSLAAAMFQAVILSDRALAEVIQGTPVLELREAGSA